jgi:hypothetical protein
MRRCLFSRLMETRQPFSVQMWAMWAIHHVCTKNLSRYCPMLFSQGGLAVIVKLLRDNNTHSSEYVNRMNRAPPLYNESSPLASGRPSTPHADHGKLNTWKRRLRAFSGNTFLLIFKQMFFPRYQDMPLRWTHIKFRKNRTEDELYRFTDSTVLTLK